MCAVQKEMKILDALWPRQVCFYYLKHSEDNKYFRKMEIFPKKNTPLTFKNKLMKLYSLKI